MSRIFIPAWRMYLLTLVVITGFGGICARLYVLHVVQSDDLAQIAQASRRVSTEISARRGDILDRKGNLLAATRSIIHLGVDPMSWDPEIDNVQLAELARLIGEPLDVIRAKVSQKTRPVPGGYAGEVRPVRWVKLAEIEEPVYDRVQELRLKGIYGNRYYERYYPSGNSAAHVLGYVNKEGAAVTGVERMMDFWLRGQNGWKESAKDGRRREMVAHRSREVAPTDGYNAVLTLDSVVQSIVEDEIERMVEEFDPQGISIIVSEAQTGDILALGNYPQYDPNHFWDFPLENQRNRALTDVYEPGSTFKIVPVAAALDIGIIEPDSIINCASPVVRFRDREIRLPSDHKTLGKIPVREVVAKSSNRGAAIIGMMLGERRLHDAARRFGFGHETGLGLGGEVNGTLHEVKQWDGLTISRLPAGYALNATPMQVHYAMGVIASGGLHLEPRVVDHVEDAEGNAVVAFNRNESNRVLSEHTASIMAEMLQRVVSNDGTASRAIIPGYAVAGKTGTSRKIIDGRYSHSHHFASFSGFFPADDPRLVITVVVDDARTPGVAYGGVVAAPAFRSIAEQLIQYFSIQPPPATGAFMVAN